MISVVISAHNEEKNIKECIASCKGLDAEIIVVDNSSNDNTAKIAKDLGAVVYSQVNNPFEIDIQKNFGFSKATGDWIISLDADERLTPLLIKEIISTISTNTESAGYYIPRKNIIFGKWIKHALWWPDYQLRLFKKGKAKFQKASVHEQVKIQGKTFHFAEPMIHKSYEHISEYVNKFNSIYTEVEAQKFLSKKKKISPSDAINLPLSDFMKTFFLQKGYRDGIHGLVLSMLQAFYMFLVFAKAWEKQGFFERNSKDVLEAIASEFDQISDEMKYWILTVKYQDARNPIKKFIFLLARKITM